LHDIHSDVFHPPLQQDPLLQLSAMAFLEVRLIERYSDQIFSAGLSQSAAVADCNGHSTRLAVIVWLPELDSGSRAAMRQIGMPF
jgi:hypothetical protein